MSQWYNTQNALLNNGLSANITPSGNVQNDNYILVNDFGFSTKADVSNVVVYANIFNSDLGTGNTFDHFAYLVHGNNIISDNQAYPLNHSNVASSEQVYIFNSNVISQNIINDDTFGFALKVDSNGDKDVYLQCIKIKMTNTNIGSTEYYVNSDLDLITSNLDELHSQSIATSSYDIESYGYVDFNGGAFNQSAFEFDGYSVTGFDFLSLANSGFNLMGVTDTLLNSQLIATSGYEFNGYTVTDFDTQSIANSNLSALSNSQFDFYSQSVHLAAYGFASYTLTDFESGLFTQSSFGIYGVTVIDLDGGVFFRAIQIPSSRIYPIESRYWQYAVEKRDYIYPIE